jgi:hypothetical protein
MRTRSLRDSRRHRASHATPATPAAEAIVRFNSAWLSVLSLLGIALKSLGFSLTLALNAMFGPTSTAMHPLSPKFLVPAPGFELGTFRLQGGCSTN